MGDDSTLFLGDGSTLSPGDDSTLSPGGRLDTVCGGQLDPICGGQFDPIPRGRLEPNPVGMSRFYPHGTNRTYSSGNELTLSQGDHSTPSLEGLGGTNPSTPQSGSSPLATCENWPIAPLPAPLELLRKCSAFDIPNEPTFMRVFLITPFFTSIACRTSAPLSTALTACRVRALFYMHTTSHMQRRALQDKKRSTTTRSPPVNGVLPVTCYYLENKNKRWTGRTTSTKNIERNRNTGKTGENRGKGGGRKKRGIERKTRHKTRIKTINKP